MGTPFPGDPPGRAWIEAAGTSPGLVDQYRPTLVAFVAFDRGQFAHLVGTGFIICGNADWALVVTARHVLEGVAEIQRPARQRKLTLGAKDLRAVWMGSKAAAFLHVIHAFYNSSTDLAVCIVAPQEIDRAAFVPVSVPLHPTLPRVGDKVQMVSADKMEITELAPPSDSSGKDQQPSIFRRVSIRVLGLLGGPLRGEAWQPLSGQRVRDFSGAKLRGYSGQRPGTSQPRASEERAPPWDLSHKIETSPNGARHTTLQSHTYRSSLSTPCFRQSARNSS